MVIRNNDTKSTLVAGRSGRVLIGCCGSAFVRLHLRNGEQAAAAARDAFSATGSVMGTALGYRLYRRPLEGRLASTSKHKANDFNSSASRPEGDRRASSSRQA